MSSLSVSSNRFPPHTVLHLREWSLAVDMIVDRDASRESRIKYLFYRVGQVGSRETLFKISLIGQSTPRPREESEEKSVPV